MQGAQSSGRMPSSCSTKSAACSSGSAIRSRSATSWSRVTKLEGSQLGCVPGSSGHHRQLTRRAGIFGQGGVRQDQGRAVQCRQDLCQRDTAHVRGLPVVPAMSRSSATGQVPRRLPRMVPEYFPRAQRLAAWSPTLRADGGGDVHGRLRPGVSRLFSTSPRSRR